MSEAKKVLIVDDQEDLREVLARMLKEEGFNVTVAEDGDSGFKIAVQEKPDLILLDIIMAKVDGLTMLKKLRDDEWGKDAHVILFTQLDDPKSLSEALELGSYEYFVKTDWKVEDVVERVKKALE